MSNKDIYTNAILYYQWSTTIYTTYYMPLYTYYNDTFWPLLQNNVLTQPWFFPTVTIVSTVFNLLLVNF